MTTEVSEFARVFKAQHRIEECLKRAKGQAGLGDYQVRTWSGWHHHQTLALLATWFLTQETRRGKNADAGVGGAAGGSFEHRALLPVVQDLARRRWVGKRWQTRYGRPRGGRPFDKTSLYRLLTNVLYAGKVRYKNESHDGEQPALIDADTIGRVRALLRSHGPEVGPPNRPVASRRRQKTRGPLHTRSRARLGR